MKKSAWYTNLLITITILPFMVTSCQKEDSDTSERNDVKKLVAFKIDVGFNMTSSTMKSLGDSIFDTFEHQYAPGANTVFRAADGTYYDQIAMGIDIHSTSIKTAVYRLPVGVYTVTGDAGIQVHNCIEEYMYYSINQSNVVIKEDTKSIPVILNPECYAILVADPYHQVDTTTAETDIHFLYNTGYYIRMPHYKKLRYVYSQATPGAGGEYNGCGVGFTRWDGTKVYINSFNFTSRHLYKIYINKNSTTSPVVSANPNPSFIVDSVKIY